MRIRKFNESLDDDFIVSPIRFNNSRGEEKTIYPSIVVDFIKTSWQTRDKIVVRSNMVDVAQSVRVVVCGTIGRGFESHLPPSKSP